MSTTVLYIFIFQRVVCDSYIVFHLDKEDADIMIVTYTCHEEQSGDPVVAVRKFRRVKAEQLRRISVIWIFDSKHTYLGNQKQIKDVNKRITKRASSCKISKQTRFVIVLGKILKVFGASFVVCCCVGLVRGLFNWCMHCRLMSNNNSFQNY